MKMLVSSEEWYPVLRLLLDDGESGGVLEEFSDEELLDYNRVLMEFCAWQAKLAERTDMEPGDLEDWGDPV